MKKLIMLIGIVGLLILLSGCAWAPEKPESALSVAELFANPLHETPIQIYGQVSALGEVMCTCFFLESDGENIHVWYDTMVEDDGTIMPAVDTSGIKNGDWVIVSGVMKLNGVHYSPNDFWASQIDIVE